MAQCSYKDPPGRPCPHDAEPGEELCVFHLPAGKQSKAQFWKHLANYILALLEKAGNEATTAFETEGEAWIFEEKHATLLEQYKVKVIRDMPWLFTGFVFPDMDDSHNLARFVFGPADFRKAQFSGDANFTSAQFSSNAHFSKALFSGKADFPGVQFSGKADFSGTQFSGKADFSGTQFSGTAHFSAARFSRNTCFTRAQFSGKVSFLRARFSGYVDYTSAQFSGNADFTYVEFSRDAEFSEALWAQNADFSRTKFLGPAYFSRAKVDGLLEFYHATLRNRLMFEGTRFGDKARVLLWGLNFAHGTSDIRMQEGHKKGELVEPAGQVVFRDISEGIDKVSFLHTEIFTDRLLVRFRNVTWEKDPKKFIFDARFVFHPVSEWTEGTGLPKGILDRLPILFNTRREPPKDETETQETERKQQELAKCEPLVELDVECIAREIRRSHEEYGSYPDAGDYYIAEMDYRRTQTPRFSFHRLALLLYKHISNYGESPGRALMSLLFVHLASTLGYLLTGFDQGKHTVKPLFASGWPYMGAPLMDFCRSLLCSAFNLVPGYFRGQPLSFTANPVLAIIEALLGVTVLTLFLLAIRRRFRR